MDGLEGMGPSLALAGAGALHGLNPAAGWALAAADRACGGTSVAGWRALLWLAMGHVAAVAVRGLTAVRDVGFDAAAVRGVAIALFVLALVLHFVPRLPRALRESTGPAPLALAAFVMAGLHGAGLGLVPALTPLCGTASAWVGGLGLALAGVGVHLAAMLAVTGVLSAVAARGIGRLHHRVRHWPQMLAAGRMLRGLQPAGTVGESDRFRRVQAGAARRSRAA